MLLIGFLGLVAGVVAALVRANELAERVRRLEERVALLLERLPGTAPEPARETAPQPSPRTAPVPEPERPMTPAPPPGPEPTTPPEPIRVLEPPVPPVPLPEPPRIPPASPIPEPPRIPPASPIPAPTPWSRAQQPPPVLPPAEVAGRQGDSAPRPLAGPGQAGPRETGAHVSSAPVRRSEDWEAIIGGNWFNKLGALVLVVGLALFVAYSFTRLGPGGRVAVAYAAGLTLLVGGVVLERREPYVVVSRGLVAGGWAAVYFTTYALHGIEATRLVGDPATASVLLAIVALGMIVHSLHYRDESVTLLAFVVGYATLVVSPLSAFAAVGSIPLLLVLLVTADRFGWHRLALFGVVATYASFAVVWGTARADDLFLARHLRREAFLVVYWFLFEAFDVASAARRRARPGEAKVVFLLNAIAFAVISMVQWARLSPETLDRLFAGMALAFVASTIARALLRPPSSFPADWRTADRVQHGGYEGPLTAAVPLAALAILFRYEGGLDSTVGLLLEAETLVLASLVLRAPYLRSLAAVFAWLPVIKLAMDDLVPFGPAEEDGLVLHPGTPLALVVAGVAYLNPLFALLRGEPGRAAERGWSYMATLLLVSVLAVEVPFRYVAAAWLALGLALFEVGVRRGAPDLRYQAYVVVLFALWVRLLAHFAGSDYALRPYESATLATGTAVAYLIAARLARLGRGTLPDWEQRGVRDLASCLGTALAAGLLYDLLPDRWVGLAWALLAPVVVEVGLRAGLPALRLSGHATAAAAVVAMAVFDFREVGDVAVLSHRLLSVLPAVVIFASMGVRLRIAQEAGLLGGEEAGLRRAYGVVSFLLAVVLIRTELGQALAVIGWAVLGLGLLVAGVRRVEPDLRYEAYAAVLLALCAGVLGHLFGADQLFRPYRTVTLAAGAAVAYLMTACLARLPVGTLPDWEQRGVRDLASCLGTALAAGLLYDLLPDRWVGLAWTFLAAAVIEAGLRARLPVLRNSGHTAAFLAVLAMAVFDFRGIGDGASASHRLVSVLPAVFVFTFIRVRLEAARAAGLVGDDEARLRRAYGVASGVLSVALLRTELGRTLAVVGWTVFGLALLAVGVRRDDAELRAQSYLMALLTVGRYFTTNFSAVEPLLGLSSGLVTGVVVVAAFYTSQLILPRREPVPARAITSLEDLRRSAEERARAGFSLLATAVLTLVVYDEASRWLLTVAWGVEAVLLLVAGFALRERVMRLSGLVLLGGCVLKVFLYDLRELDALPRILSFIVLGLSLIGVSLVYTRFREQLRKLL